jgi:hypothetical protein
METRTAQTIANQNNNFSALAGYVGDSQQLAQQRLDVLLELNAETARQKLYASSESDLAEAATMKHPLSDQQVFAYFGILLGVFPPLALFAKFFINAGNFRFEDLWIFGVVAVVNLITAVVGYFSGKIVGKIVSDLEKLSWAKMLLTLPFIGLLWGGIAGGAGGVIIFVLGAIFGAMVGSVVGTFALPIFAIFHRLLRKDGKMDRKEFLPLAFGISLVISAFILGA